MRNIRPNYYGGANNPLEAWKIIQHYELDFFLGNVLKYVLRAGKKSDKGIEDLLKASTYLQEAIAQKERAAEAADVEHNAAPKGAPYTVTLTDAPGYAADYDTITPVGEIY